ncbi:MAG: SdpI family protein [Bacteroidota bacterium]
MKKILSIVFLIVPFILIAWYWNELPDSIPMHWNAAGEIDRYSDSKWGIVVLPVINLFTFLLLFIVPKIDPKGNFSQFLKTYWTIINILMLFFMLLFMFMLYASLGHEFNQSMVIHSALYILFLLLGNFFGKLRPNYFIGIRTPWTLESEEVWKKTHRMGGVLWVTSSVFMLIFNFIFPDIGQQLFIAYVIVISIIPVAYSFIAFRQLSAKETQN